MHYYQFNPADFNNSARHLTLPERAIYRDLIDMYYGTEQSIDGSDMDALARRLLCTTPEYRASLEYILGEFFTKRGKRYHHARIDREIKNYRHSQTKKASHAGVTPDVTDSHGNVTHSVTPCHNDVTQDDVTMTAAERQRKSRQEKKQMLDDLNIIGVSVAKGMRIGELRELHAQHIDAINKYVTSNVTDNTNDDVTNNVTSSHTPCHESHEQIGAITTNDKLSTSNQEPFSESTHANTGEAAVDNLGDNSVTSQQPVTTSTATAPVDSPAVITAAQQIRNQRMDDINDWQAPSIDAMHGELFKAGKMMQLTDAQYEQHVDGFKAHYAEQALVGKALVTDANRKAKLLKWMIGEADKQAATKARQNRAQGRFNIDNEDWETTGTAGKSNRSSYDSDLPPVFHPSHSQPTQTARPDPKKSVMLNGVWFVPLPNMSIKETYAYISAQQDAGESQDETYKRVLKELEAA